MNEKHQRAESLVRKAFPGMSRRHVREAIEAGLVGGPTKARLAKGKRVESAAALELSGLKRHLEVISLGNRDLKVPVVFESDDYWVVDKPSGIPCQPLGLFETNTLTHWAFGKDSEIAGRFGGVQPELTPHRLDIGTSGLVVVARTPSAFAEWRKRFTGKRVTKTYLAWCWGKPAKSAWSCEAAIGKAPGRGGSYQVGGRDPRQASSQIRVLEGLSDRFLAEVTCRTGVTHQVRVHLSDAGFPLLGDSRYDSQSNRPHRPEHHLLRAIRLAYEDTAFEAERRSFTEMFE